MFNDRYSLTQAVLDGRKTMTRRICKYDRPSLDWEIAFPITENEGDYESYEDLALNAPNFGSFCWQKIDGSEHTKLNKLSYREGEVVAIAQSYKSFFGGFKASGNSVEYEGIWYDFDDLKAGWNNKMFVHADLMPHKIKITNAFLQRLQNISDEDCMREGVQLNTRQFEYDGTRRYCVSGLGHWRRIGCDSFNTPKEAFATLIDKISGKGTWERNPYVIVYEFELLK